MLQTFVGRWPPFLYQPPAWLSENGVYHLAGIRCATRRTPQTVRPSVSFDWLQSIRFSPCAAPLSLSLSLSPLASVARDSYAPSSCIRCHDLTRSPGIGPPRLFGATLRGRRRRVSNRTQGSVSVRTAEAERARRKTSVNASRSTRCEPPQVFLSEAIG